MIGLEFSSECPLTTNPHDLNVHLQVCSALLGLAAPGGLQETVVDPPSLLTVLDILRKKTCADE
jgi:hypothetical protein